MSTLTGRRSHRLYKSSHGESSIDIRHPIASQKQLQRRTSRSSIEDNVSSHLSAMLLIRCQDIDITQYYVSNTLSKTEQLNNRANTAKMRIIDYRIQENQRVDIREYVELVQPTASTDTVLYVDQLYTESNKFLPGMEIRLGDGIGTDVYASIASLDTVTNTIVLTGQI